MNRILEIVGYEGITEGHTYAVNDLPFVHDELLANVAYQSGTLEKLKSYFSRVQTNSLRIFESEVTRALSCNAKYSDMLLRLPEGRLSKGTEPFTLLAGQNVTQTYDLTSVLQYGIVKFKGIVMYFKGNAHIRIAVRLDYQGIIKGEDIFTEDFIINTAASDMLNFKRFDLSSIDLERAIDSKSQDQLVIEIQCLGNTNIYPQDFVYFEPGLTGKTEEFAINGGFSQGFSDGFSIAKGLTMGEIKPLVSFAGTMIAFDVDAYISDNAYRLGYAFAHRVAARLLADKLTGANLNIFTNSESENTQMQMDFIEKALKQHLKMIENTLLFNIQSTQTPPIALHNGGGVTLGSYIDEDSNTRWTDDGAYPTPFL